jgi:hypothetical protein
MSHKRRIRDIIAISGRSELESNHVHIPILPLRIFKAAALGIGALLVSQLLGCASRRGWFAFLQNPKPSPNKAIATKRDKEVFQLKR